MTRPPRSLALLALALLAGLPSCGESTQPGEEEVVEVPVAPPDPSLVTVTRTERYWKVEVDYSSAPSPTRIGSELAEAIVAQVPQFPQLYDGFVFGMGSKVEPGDPKAGCLRLIESALSMEAQIPTPYLQEMDGMSSVLSDGAPDVCGDGRLSRNELVLANLFLDVLGAETYFGRGFVHCNAIAVYGDTSTTGHPMTTRILDWEADADLCAFHQVMILDYGERQIVSVGLLGLTGVMTGVNSNGTFLGLLYAHTGAPFEFEDPHSLVFDLRFVLELSSSMAEAARYTTSPDFDYMMNNILIFSDPSESVIVENGFSPTAEGTQRRDIRRGDSELNPGVEWEFPDSVATVNGLVLKGQFDNQTGEEYAYNQRRWESFQMLMEKHLAPDGTISYDELKTITSFHKGPEPGPFGEGDIYDSLTRHITLYKAERDGDDVVFTLDAFFCPAGKDLPPLPDFENVYTERLPAALIEAGRSAADAPR